VWYAAAKTALQDQLIHPSPFLDILLLSDENSPKTSHLL